MASTLDNRSEVRGGDDAPDLRAKSGGLRRALMMSTDAGPVANALRRKHGLPTIGETRSGPSIGMPVPGAAASPPAPDLSAFPKVRAEHTGYGYDSPHSMFADMARIAAANRHAEKIIAKGGRVPADDEPGLPERGRTVEGARRRLRSQVAQRNVATTDFMPADLWLAQQFATAARARAEMPDLLRRADLPERGQSVAIPTIGDPIVAVAHAAADSLTPAAPDTLLATSDVVTIAAATEVSMQMLDRSGGAGDLAVSAELAAALADELDRQIIAGSGTGAELSGLLTEAGHSVTYTSGSPDAAAIRSKLWSLVDEIGDEPDLLLLHPRRAAFLAVGVDNSGDRVMKLRDLPGDVHAVGTIPANLGTGTNEDVAIAMRRDAAVLLMGRPAIDVRSDEGDTATGVVRVVARMYAALVVRQPDLVATLSGTGMGPVSF